MSCVDASVDSVGLHRCHSGIDLALEPVIVILAEGFLKASSTGDGYYSQPRAIYSERRVEE